MDYQEINIKLVREVEKHPVLYNYNLPDYSRREALDKAWNEVANEVNMTATECKDKWRNLRTVFARKIKLSPCSLGSKRKRAYYLSDAMKFAIPFIKTSVRSSCGNLPESSEKENSQTVYLDASESLTVDEEDFYVNEQLSPIEMKLVEDPLSLPLPPEENPPTSVPAPVKNLETMKSSTKKCSVKQRAEIEADKAITAYFNAKRSRLEDDSTQRSSQDERKEALKMFLLSLMPELVQLSDAHINIFKRRVFNLIDDLALKETN